jgi:hypothetical protein
MKPKVLAEILISGVLFAWPVFAVICVQMGRAGQTPQRTSAGFAE